MARGTSFLDLVTMLRAELRRSINPAVGVEDIPELKRLLVRNYEMLALEYDWPHLLRLFPKIDLQAGQNQYNVPAGMAYERIKDVAAWFNGLPLPIERGIGFNEYAIFNPDAGNRSSPVLKWDVGYGDGVQEMIEVWPVPTGNGLYQIQFLGYSTVPRLVNDEDQCLLDDNLVVLFAGADAAAASGAKDAKTKAAAAQHLLNRLKGRSENNSRQISIGQGAQSRPLHPTRTTVLIGGR